MTILKHIYPEPDRPGENELGRWVGWGALRATCPFCDGEGYYEPERSPDQASKRCEHFHHEDENGCITFQGAEDGDLLVDSLWLIGTTAMRMVD